MNQHIKFGDGWFLNEQTVELDAKDVIVKGGVNHIWLVDRSGSMYGELPQLIEDLKQRQRDLGPQDSLSFGWFSGEGKHEFVFKGLRLVSEQDHINLDKGLDRYKQTVGLTCFSEILEETNDVITDLSFLEGSFALWLFTDGYPVVNNHKKEIDKIMVSLTRLEDRLTSAQFVGYGDYYNKELMSDMATWAGGELRHCSDRSAYSSSLQYFIENTDSTTKVRIKIEALDGVLAIYTKDGAIKQYQADDEGYILVSPPENYFCIYTITRSPASHSVETPIEIDSEGRGWPVYGDKKQMFGIMAGVVILNQKLKTNLALDLLAAIGDQYWFNRLSQCFTPQEHGEVEANIAESIQNNATGWIYSEGYSPNCQADANAFCVLDLLNLLMDYGAEFLPSDLDFEYKRTGRKTVTKEGYPEFQPIKNAGAKLSNLTWNNSKLSLSALVKIPGIVYLPDADSVGLVNVIPTFIYRNYTIIKDGNLWTTKLPVLLKSGAANDITYIDGGKVLKISPYAYESVTGYAKGVLHLSELPLINRAIADSADQPGMASKLANLSVADAVLGAYLKVYKSYKTEEPEESSLYTPEQVEFLKQYGITSKGYNPPKETEPETDRYSVKTFELKVKGFSSLPKVSEVVEMRTTGKGYASAPKRAMAEAIDRVERCTNNLTEEVKNDWLDCEIAQIKIRQKDIRNEIQRTKFSVILGKRWFDEFSTREDCVIDGVYKDYIVDVSFVLGEEIVKV